MFLEILKAVFIGIVQGITEWLPVSSTGHMILFDRVVTLDASQEFKDFFLVAIQLGSILAVLFTFFERLNPFSRKKSDAERKRTLSLWGRVIVGCIPAGVAGVLLDDFLEGLFYSGSLAPLIIAGALILYGVFFILIERRGRGCTMRVESTAALSYRDALLIGLFQILSLIPGTSRSGSTILGACLLGVGRTAAAEFSFFMALPVMAGASLLKGYKFFASGVGISGTEIAILLVGIAVAFALSLFAIRFLLDFVKRHSFEAFGWYRIALGAVVLILFACGILK